MDEVALSESMALDLSSVSLPPILRGDDQQLGYHCSFRYESLHGSRGSCSPRWRPHHDWAVWSRFLQCLSRFREGAFSSVPAHVYSILLGKSVKDVIFQTFQTAYRAIPVGPRAGVRRGRSGYSPVAPPASLDVIF